MRTSSPARPISFPSHNVRPEARHDDASLRAREDAFDAIRLTRRLALWSLDVPGAVVAFPTSVVDGSQVLDATCSHRPGVVRTGLHQVGWSVESAAWSVHGTFEVAVSLAPSLVPAPQWSTTGAVPAHVMAQLPASVSAAALTGAALRGPIRRAHLAAERARKSLLVANRGLVRTVVNRYRGVVRGEASSLELDDLMIVGDHQLLDVVDRCFADPDRAPMRDVAWSKLVQRAIGGAIRTEIARATGISVEFRQLLAWFHTHPDDRDAPVESVARDMAFAAGVTRLMAVRSMTNRATATALLDQMLAEGTACYVAPTREVGTARRSLREQGVFVISPRSSLAEIGRAQSFQGVAALVIDDDADDATPSSAAVLSHTESGFDEADATDCVRRTIALAGMTSIEALVWLHRSGVLDPGGQGSELPEIAADLGLNGRAEARAALRRARRKLECSADRDFLLAS